MKRMLFIITIFLSFLIFSKTVLADCYSDCRSDIANGLDYCRDYCETNSVYPSKSATSGLTTNITGEVEKIKNTDATPFFGANLGDYITRFLKIGMIIGALGCLIFLILGGIAWVTSGGDKQKVEDARNKITSSIIGLAVLASIFVLWTLVMSFFGLDKSDLLQIEGLNDGSNLTCEQKCSSSGDYSLCMRDCAEGY